MSKESLQDNPQNSGWILLDKPEGISSAKALAIVKNSLGVPKAGHAGTLDPVASGLLLIALGEACKLLSLLNFTHKSYQFDLCWGYETDTDDNEGKPTLNSEHFPNEKDIRAACHDFIGNYPQLPPAYSALKINGKRAYQLAREGKETPLKARNVDVLAFDLQKYAPVKNQALILGLSKHFTKLGKGGYVRSLGRDLAAHLKGRAHVQHIRRTEIGNLSIEKAIPLDFFQEKFDKSKSERWGKVLHLSSVLDGIPVLDVNTAQYGRFRHGQRIPTVDFSQKDIPQNSRGEFLLKHAEHIVGIGKFKGNCIAPRRLINT